MGGKGMFSIMFCAFYNDQDKTHIRMFSSNMNKNNNYNIAIKIFAIR